MLKKSNPDLKFLPLTFVCAATALLIGIFILGFATDFGKSFTTESYRRHQIARHPAEIPNVLLINVNGEQEHLKDSIRKDGRFVLLDFFYTSCKSICTSQTSVFDNLQEKIKINHLENKVRLISISFDPERDDVKSIKDYSNKAGAESSIWHIFTLRDPNDLGLLLDNFGIYVIKIPPFNDLDHNASLHLIDPQGNLIQISNLEDVDELFSTLIKKL